MWSDSTELIVNPCVEIGMYPVDEKTGEYRMASMQLEHYKLCQS